MSFVRNSILPARLFAHSLSPTAPRLARRLSKLARAALAQWLPRSVGGLPQANNRVLPSASHHKAQREDDYNSCSAGSLLTNGPVTLLID